MNRNNLLYVIIGILTAIILFQISYYTFVVLNKVEKTDDKCARVISILENWEIDDQN